MNDRAVGRMVDRHDDECAALEAEIERLKDTMESCIELLRDDKVNRAVMRMRAALKGGDDDRKKS